jgi:DNA/RNA endonuclease YhcR with UshA esterase domain
MEGWIMRLAPDIRWKGVVLAVAVTITAACATVPGRPDIRQVQQQSGRFVDHSVTITGEVTSSWGVPLVGFNVYRVDDGTGEITVVSTDRRVPNKGARVEVRGKVEDVAVLGGRPLGLHLREQRVRYR